MKLQRNIILISWFCFFASSLKAAPIPPAWQIPSTHFDSVDALGHLSYWLPLHDLCNENDCILPFAINFNSGNDNKPEIGPCLFIAPLDSYSVQLSETDLSVVHLDGLKRNFKRAKTSNGPYKSSDGWTAILNGNQLLVSNNDGWKYSYFNGRLMVITSPNGKTVDLVYTDKKVSEIKTSGSVLLKVQSQEKNGAIDYILPNERVTITRLKNNTVVIKDKNGEATFKFEVSNDSQVFKVSKSKENERCFFWDPKTGTIISDDSWKYSIKPAPLKSVGESALIERVNSQGISENWHFSHEQEVFTDTNGVRHIATYLIGPGNSPKLRKVETVQSGEQKTEYKASFDESGKLIRVVDKGKESGFVYDDKGRVIEINGKNGVQIKREYIGTLLNSEKYSYPNGSQIRIVFLSPNTVNVMVLTRSSGFLCLDINTDDIFNVLGYDPRKL